MTDGKGLFVALAIIGAINAAIGAYYYLRIAAVMFLRDGIRPPVAVFRPAVLVTIGVCLALTIGLGVYPTPVMHAIRNAVTGGVDPAVPMKVAAVP